MKTIIVLCSLLVGTFALDACACNRMLLPVCGSDGVTYSNPCLLRCAGSQQNKDIKIVSYGPCQGVNFAQKEDICICTREFAPVCGSDGQTYPNLCEFHCAQKKTPSLTVTSYDECNAVETEDICICNRMYMPVCGSDGKTYGNPCELGCEKRKNPNLSIVKYEQCENTDEISMAAYNPCICNKMYMPVCGSDGLTYGNPCMFQCARSQNPGLTMRFQGECPAVPYPPRDPCMCTREFNPVCGSDGLSYGNPCMFRCAQSKSPWLHMVHYGECKARFTEAIAMPCKCNKMYSPVCGSDGKTYSNPCMLNCAKSGSSGLTMVHRGMCSQVSFVEKPTCACNRMYRPVCGSNGVTYANPCLFNCAKKTNKNLTMKAGKCSANIFAVEKETNDCLCSKEYSPVCGTDLVTYSNMCMFKCAAAKKTGLKLLYPMVCMII